LAHGGLEMAHDGLAHGQQVNPTKLPPCPPADNSKKTDNARVEKWHKCYGKFIVQFDAFQKGDAYEGEFLNGKLNGYGIHKSTSGNVYAGAFKNGQYNGVGALVSADGIKFSGRYADGRRKGYGVETYQDGSKKEGIWSGFDVISQETGNSFRNPASRNVNQESDDIFAINPVYDLVRDFSEGLAGVRIGDSVTGKWGFINKTGKIVIPAKFDEVGLFKDGLAPVRFGSKEDGKWGYINKVGVLAISAKFNSASSFSESLAAVSIGVGGFAKYGYIDKQGNFQIPPLFGWAFGFSEGVAAVNVGSILDRRWGYIDKIGKFIIEPQFDSAMDFVEGLAVVSKKIGGEEKWGAIDKQANVAVKFEFDWIFLYFKDGLAAVRMGAWNNGKWGFIDKKGAYVISPKFDGAFPFSHGLAAVRVGDDDNGLWGFINEAGEFSIAPQFGTAVKFKEGLAPVSVGKGVDKKIGYIDTNGKLVIHPQFFVTEELPAQFFSDGLAPSCIKVDLSVKCGFIAQTVEQASKIAAKQNSKQDKAAKQKSPQTSLLVSATAPDANGGFNITIQTNTDTASLKINGEEQGGRADGNYSIKRVARVGQDTQFTITAVDVYGNSDTKTITVTRQAAPAADTSIALKPEAIKRASTRDAVAIIIGIQDYKRVPKAEFANNDAKEFYEYAIRALGIKQEKIKMLLDDEADEVNIVKAFENWLPIQVNKDKTDVYVFYSGHGLPAPDGKSLYFLPHGVDKELLSRTAVGQNEIVAALSAAKPKSVTMFIDACYSGQTRGGDVLMANAKPLSLKSDTNAYPPNFTVITASANDQISSSSPELKHGIFSFYLMKGMEGEADANKDGKITVGEMQDYLSDKVSRQAMTLNRKQSTQLVGDGGRVLVGR
jgi:hypothetical protein